MRKGLVWQIVAGMVLGLLFGFLSKQYGQAVKPLGDIFINMIKIVIIPLVFSVIISSIASMGNLKKVGKLGFKTLVYFEIITTIALIVGLLVTNLTQPGVGVNINQLEAGDIHKYTETAEHTKPIDVLVGIFSPNLFKSLAEGKILPVIFFAVMFGIALASIGEKGKVVVQFFHGVSETMFAFVHLVMRFAPFGVFALMANTIATYGFTSLIPLGKLVIINHLTIIFFIVVVFGFIAWLAKVNLWTLIRNLKEELVIGYVTDSTETVMPQLMEKMTRFGCDRSVVSFVIPTGYTFNLDGSALYQAMVVPFIAQLYGIELTLMEQFTILIVLMLTSKGIAAVPGASFAVLSATLAAVGLPVEGLALVIGIDRIMDMARGIVNIIGHSLAAIVISKWEGRFDQTKAVLFKNMPVVTDETKIESSVS
ncbi:dicarboxylate/amino acid:cation symporter [Aneurinibacillus aneurinilyticus]|jgi:proton glutamate symport protein|uniref:Cation:dicarboxylase symporter family transporter n=2 Tax=Aneurinibacillus aneurinilyticus TaxID=1391 RepID=A0A848CWE6_ANEAE|nr:cation:dicarboxylase symporter family transporter [Aneurinibacillus aneurinilyticus]ERI09678.1 proton/sodium-glutamate symport protein GltT [Aneurinibacillus aneurinilyticus ATCC 12856]MCI1696352.1 cation:dicarboxylase symporter family transporter [Aneurinibacillus aneurinilyticus]MED0672623.1 cation:dicarboxylase symporter family transporter [Aneurinibacillus aneurinilyticus]MED0708427.1 cation:dicarboxylase symporter family transporter [Aneurinibacillus aneurinilyticus]MED0722506.1 cation